jgi:hypothetical protein
LLQRKDVPIRDYNRVTVDLQGEQADLSKLNLRAEMMITKGFQKRRKTPQDVV